MKQNAKERIAQIKKSLRILDTNHYLSIGPYLSASTERNRQALKDELKQLEKELTK